MSQEKKPDELDTAAVEIESIEDAEEHQKVEVIRKKDHNVFQSIEEYFLELGFDGIPQQRKSAGTYPNLFNNGGEEETEDVASTVPGLNVPFPARLYIALMSAKARQDRLKRKSAVQKDDEEKDDK